MLGFTPVASAPLVETQKDVSPIILSSVLATSSVTNVTLNVAPALFSFAATGSVDIGQVNVSSPFPSLWTATGTIRNVKTNTSELLAFVTSTGSVDIGPLHVSLPLTPVAVTGFVDNVKPNASELLASTTATGRAGSVTFVTVNFPYQDYADSYSRAHTVYTTATDRRNTVYITK